MHRADIQAALKKNAYTQAQIAAECGVTAMTVTAVIYGRSKSLKVARAISRATHIPVDQLWPDKYRAPRARAAA